MPLITTLIPAYTKDYLGELFLGLRRQTFTDFRVILSDDSPDAEITRMLHDGAWSALTDGLDLTVVRGPRNARLNHQRLLDLWAGQTPLVHFHLDDDVIYPDFYRAHVAAHAQQPLGVSVSRRWLGSADGRPAVELPVPAFIAASERRTVELEPGALFASTVAVCENWLGELSNMVISAAGAGCYPKPPVEGINYYGLLDVGLVLEAARALPVVFLHDHLSVFRQHPGQTTQSAVHTHGGRVAFLAWVPYALAAWHEGRIGAPQAAHSDRDRHRTHRAALRRRRPGDERVPEPARTPPRRARPAARRLRRLVAPPARQPPGHRPAGGPRRRRAGLRMNGTPAMKPNRPTFVTQPELPPLEDFLPYLREIWDSRVLTNGGPFHQRLEAALCEHLGVKHISLFTNATIALVTALQSLRIGGEVITTPYSFVATAHSLLWNGIKPVFVDIDPVTLNLDPAQVEAAITPATTAILPVHCYGTPCDVDALRTIAENYNLKIIYDAAHAFGVQRGGQSVLNHGDLSILSFHATKVFNTFEGGAIVSPDARTKQHIDHLKNFGFVNETTVVATGINGKMSEFNAALGLVQLGRIDAAITRRAEIDRLYRELLADVPGIRMLAPAEGVRANHAYFPIFVEPGFPLARDALYLALRDAGIHGRRYFYPLISDFPMYRGLPSAAPDRLPVARRASASVICLPIYPALEDVEVVRIAQAIVGAGLRAVEASRPQPAATAPAAS